MKIVIVGATAAGTTFAAKMRRNHKDATIIMLERGEVTSLGACGLPFYVGGFFDDSAEMIARRPEEFISSGIEVRILHEAIALTHSKKSITIKDHTNNSTYEETYDVLVIATGASVAPMPFPVSDDFPVYPLRSLTDGELLKEKLHQSKSLKVAIIGAGFIGIEVVEGALRLGHQVTLVDVTDRPMANTFDEEFQDLIHDELTSHGVASYYGSCVQSIAGNGLITLDDGRTLESDVVVWAGGIKANTAWLHESGVLMERGIIQTNRNGKTSLDDVYAIGDCATVHHMVLNQSFYSPLATVANKMGRFLADHLAGITQEDFAGMMGAASLKVCDLEVVRVGLTLNEAQKYGLSVQFSFIVDKDHTSYYPHAEKIWIKLVYDMDGVILGAQIAGKRGAALRGSAMSFAIAKKMTIKELGLLDIPYSPPFARTWDALNVAGNASKIK